MNSPFLPIFSSPSNVVSEYHDSGSKAGGIGESGQGEETAAFSAILGESQVLQQDEQAQHNPTDSEATLSFVAFQNQELVDALVVGDEKLPDVSKSVPLLSAGYGVQDTTDPIRNSLGPLVQHNLVPGSVVHEPGGHAVATSAHLSRPQLDNLVLSLDQIPLHTDGKVIHQKGELSGSSLLAPILHRVSTETGTDANGRVSVQEQIVNQEQRIRPLLAQEGSPLVDGRPSTNSVVDTAQLNEAIVQRVLSQQDATTQLKPAVLIPSAQGVLPQSRDDLSVQLTQSDSDLRATGSLGGAQIGETGVGTGGSGLTFGNHPGHGQGQALDVQANNLSSVSQGSLAPKVGGFDERLNLLNASLPQRLQIDVQISETSRIQVDVGVQQRHVFAGVLLDNPVLRSLATQNVQELQNQLGQADMELEEFDVHAENQQWSEQSAHERGERQDVDKGISRLVGEDSSAHSQRSMLAEHQDVRGWHVVA